jgi:MerR family transcriptional regulator, light-induced transcriptional regulator
VLRRYPAVPSGNGAVQLLSALSPTPTATTRRASDWITIGELARRTGLSPDLLRAWERRYGLLMPRRTAANRRLYSLADEARVRLMQRHLAEGTPAAQAAELVAGARLTVAAGSIGQVEEQEVRSAHADLRAALDGFAETAAQRVLERLLIAHSRLAVIRDVLLPYLHDVGERWADRHITVAQEHFASTFLEARFLAMARGWDRAPGPRALLACPSGERHVFGLLAFGIALHDLGWRITYLGADTPVEMVADASVAVRPDLVALAIVMPGTLAPHDGARRLTAAWRCALGGPGATAELAGELGAHHLAADPVTAARELYASWPSTR